MAKSLRTKFTDILKRYFAGDKSLIREIEANAESTSPIPKLARAALGGEEHVAGRGINDDESFVKKRRYVDLESDRIKNMKSEFELVDSITSKIKSINPDWTDDTGLRDKTVEKLKSIMFGPASSNPEDVPQISKKPRVEIVEEPMEASPVPEKEASPIPEDLPAAEEASPDFAEALPVPEKEASPIPGDLPAAEEASLPKNRQKRMANLPASSLASVPAFNFGNGPPASRKVREEVVVDAMLKFFAKEFEECARECLLYTDIYHAFTESFCIASGRDEEIFSQQCQPLLTSQFPFVLQCISDNQRTFANVRRKLAH
jgi:hypothetical protein